jgi:hypothetical protein
VSAAKVVTRDQAKKNPQPQDIRERIGSVRYVRYEASVFLERGDDLEPAAKFFQVYRIHEADSADAIFRHAKDGGFPGDLVAEIKSTFGPGTGNR